MSPSFLKEILQTMKKLLTAALISAAGFVHATTATVDLMTIVKALPVYEKLESELQKEVTIAQKKLKEKKDLLDSKMSEIETKGETMSQQRLTKLRREISSLRRELGFMEEDLQSSIAQVDQDMKTTLMRQAQDTIQQYAKENDIEMVVSSDMTIFSSNSIDITKDIVESLS